MGFSDNPYGIDTDYSATTGDFAPTSGRVNAQPAANQAGRAVLFRDPSGVLSLANVDAQDNLFVNPVNPAGGSLQKFAGQPSGATTTQYGTLVMGRMDMPSPATYQPISIDMTGAINVHPKSKATFNAIQTGVTCAANKSLFSLYNGGSMVLRIQKVWVYSPPQSTSGALLGQAGSTYIPLIAEMRRIGGHTRGTSTASPSVATSDTADSFDTGITVYSNATLSGASAAAYHRQDILVTTITGQPFWGRSDANAKVLVIRPGEGFSVTCLSSGAIASGGGTTTASVDVEVQLTQAIA